MTAYAATSDAFTSQAVSAKLITAENAVAPNASVLSAGISIALSDGWKTYWRSPGEVGLPPEIDWSGSTNLASAEMLWPAPTRFRAFGIENFGYAKQVTFPVRLILTDPGKPAVVKADVFLLVCSDVCVPQNLTLTLNLPAGTGIDRTAASEIAKWSAKVPSDGALSDLVAKAHFSDDKTLLTVAITGSADWPSIDIFPELDDSIAFGKPDIRAAPDGYSVWATFPIFGDGADPSKLALTMTTADTAVAFETVHIIASAPEAPFTKDKISAGFAARLWMLLIAFLGGLILNVMPCVLPVLSIKFTSALKMSGRPIAQTRLGFLASAAGTVSFMWALAAGVLVLQALGVSVGWGLQFQNAYFLIALILVLAVFTANLLGVFEFSLPQGLMTRLSRSRGHGYAGDFATGAFGAVMATPCSAPLLGTALAFALTGTTQDVVMIFTAMGIGLALPYLVVAARPKWISQLPQPGRWMIAVKATLGAMLFGTLVWLLWVLQAVSNLNVMTAIVAILTAILICIIWNNRVQSSLPVVVALIVASTSFALPMMLKKPAAAQTTDLNWVPFSRSDIPKHVSLGHRVVVDVTADWCLTCKANKILVLSREPVAGALAAPDIIAMQADWTRPDPAIQQFLESNGRFGIPFNVIYGPAAPEGIVLSEVLTEASVMNALSQAAKQP
ncbi:MAG: thioredoxin family protein [Yoonia sp.]|nr:thioredoxin family protein [Yoonia sp.]